MALPTSARKKSWEEVLAILAAKRDTERVKVALKPMVEIEKIELSPTHDNVKKVVFRLVIINNMFPKTEYRLENQNRYIYVVWRKTQKSAPPTSLSRYR